MKFRVPDIVLGALLAVAVFAMGMLFASSGSRLINSAAQQHSSEKQSAEKPAEHNTKTESLWVPTDSVGLYTLVLAVFTGLLVAVSSIQGWFLLRADKTARIAANAADRSARAAIALQLPIIRIHPDKLGHGDTLLAGGLKFEECSVSSVVISNLGPTKAFPLEILYGFTIGNDLPSEPSYRYLDRFPTNIIFEPNVQFLPRKSLTMAMPLKTGQRADILKGNYLWFYCALRYEDFMGEIHSHGFCWRWAYVGSGLDWRGDDTPAYNRKT
jgi:hypothetical protein